MGLVGDVTRARAPRRRVVLLAGALLAVTGPAACGDDGGDESGGGGAASTTTATVPAAIRDFCDAFGTIIAGPLNDEATDVRDPLVLQGAVALTEELLALAVASAPDDLAAPMAEVAAEYGAVFDLWERYGFDLLRLEAEGTPEEQAFMDSAFAAPASPGEPDAFAVVQDGYFSRCTAGVTLPDDALPATVETTAGP